MKEDARARGQLCRRPALRSCSLLLPRRRSTPTRAQHGRSVARADEAPEHTETLPYTLYTLFKNALSSVHFLRKAAFSDTNLQFETFKDNSAEDILVLVLNFLDVNC